MGRGQFILIKDVEWVGGETFEQLMDLPIGGSKSPNSFIFMQISANIWSNNRFLPQKSRGWRPPSGKSWIQHCYHSFIYQATRLLISTVPSFYH